MPGRSPCTAGSILNRNECSTRLSGRDDQFLAALMREQVQGNLSADQPHCPTRNQNATQEHNEAVKPVTDHIAAGFPMGDAEDDRRKKRKHKRRAEVSKLDGHCFFPMAMW